MMKLEIIEILLFYDQPHLFTVQGEMGSMFICLFVDVSESGANVYIGTPISSSRLYMLTSGWIDVRYLYTNPESSSFLQITENQDGSLAGDEFAIQVIPENYLPDAGVYLSTPTVDSELYAKIRSSLLLVEHTDFAAKSSFEPVKIYSDFKLGNSFGSDIEGEDLVAEFKGGAIYVHLTGSTLSKVDKFEDVWPHKIGWQRQGQERISSHKSLSNMELNSLVTITYYGRKLAMIQYNRTINTQFQPDPDWYGMSIPIGARKNYRDEKELVLSKFE